MALVDCPECGRPKVSDQAPACPNCGAPIASRPPVPPEPRPAFGTRIDPYIEKGVGRFGSGRFMVALVVGAFLFLVFGLLARGG